MITYLESTFLFQDDKYGFQSLKGLFFAKNWIVAHQSKAQIMKS